MGGFFGINDISLLTQPGPSMLVSASTGECLVSTKGSLKMQNCEQAADAEDGRSTFTLGPSSQLQTQSGDCVFLTDAGASVAPCSSGEGKQVFLTPVREVDSDPAAHVR